MKEERAYYGAKVQGVSGTETFYCPCRGTANRIRRAYRAYRDSGRWTGWSTLAAFAHHAAACHGMRVPQILETWDASKPPE